MDISALWKAQTCEQHSLICYSKQRMQTSYLRTGYWAGAEWKEVAGGSREVFNLWAS